MEKLNPWRVGGSVALTAAITSVLCAAAVNLSPDGAVNFVNSWMHGLDIAVLKSDKSLTLGSLAYGLFNVTMTGFLVGALFACCHNLLAWSVKRR